MIDLDKLGEWAVKALALIGAGVLIGEIVNAIFRVI